MVPRPAGCLRWRVCLAALAAAIPGSALADTLYWVGTTNSLWTGTASWSTSSSAPTPNPAAVPGSSDDVWFNVSGSNAANNVYLNGNQAANSLTFRSSGSTALLSGAAANSGVQALSLGGGGVTVNSGAGVTTLGNSANPIAFTLTTSQTWANNASAALSAYGSFVGSAASGTQSFAVGGSGATTISGSIGDGAGGGALQLVKIGSGTLTLTTGTIGSGTSGYTGGVWIQSGRLQLTTATNASQPAITSFDPLLGAVPATPTAANIRIGDGATLGLDMTFGAGGSRSISANRGIQIDGTSRIEFTGDQRGGRSFSYGGVISSTTAGARLVLSSAPGNWATVSTNAMTATFSGTNTFSGSLLVTTTLVAATNPQVNRWAVVLSGSNNFATGVVIDGVDAAPILRSGTAGALGQNIAANGVTINFGELSLASAAALGSNQTVTVNGYSGMLNTVDLGYSGAVPANVAWKSAYGGVVGVGVGAFSQQLDMGTLGSQADGSYGRLFLGVGQYGNGGTVKTGTYSAAALGVGADSTYRLGGGGNNSQPGVLVFSSGVLTGANNVVVGRNAAWNGSAEIRLSATNTYSGSTTIDQGMLTLTTASGAIPNTSAITINTGGTLKLDNTSSANNTNRVPDATPISVNGGTINFSNNAGAANYSESLGALTLGKGLAAITTSQAASGSTSTLTFASLARNAGSGLQVNGVSVGADARNRIVFTDPAGIKDNAGNSIASGAVIPWAVNGYNSGTNYTSGTLTGFMTHQSGTLQAYAYTADETKTGTSGWTNDSAVAFASTANVRWLPGVTGGAATITLPSGTTTINSLSYYGSGASVPNPATITISGATDRLVITSGGIYAASTDANRGITIGGSGVLTAGAGVTEMVFSTGNANGVSARIVDPDGSTAMGVTIAASSQITFSALNTYSGNTVIANGASLRPTTVNALPFGAGKGDVYVYGTLGANGVSSNNGFTVNGLWGNGSVTAITGGLTVGANNASSQFDGIFPQGNLTGGVLAGTPLTKIGSGTLTLTGYSPLMTGSFTINEGTLAVTSVRDGGYASALGAFSTSAANLVIAGSSANATLRYIGQDPNSTNRLFTVGGTAAGVTATIDASGSTPNATSGVDSRATISFTGTGAIAYGTANRTRTLAFAGTNTGTNTFAPQINDNGTGVVSVVKDGVGQWVLSGSNAYSGGATVSLGQLTLGHANALGTGTTTVNGGVLAIGGYAPSVAGFTISSGSLAGSGTLTATSGYALQGGAVSAILGSGAIAVSSGTTTLGSGGRFNSASGLTISSGQLTLGGSESVASFVLSGGVLAGSGNTLTSAAGYDVQSGSVLANLGGTVGLTKSSSGTVTLSGANTYTDGSQIAAGTLRLGSNTALPTSSSVSLGTGSTSATLDFNTNTVTLGSITFNGSGSQLSPSGKLNLLASGTNNATITVTSGSHILHPDTSLQSNTVIDVNANAIFTLHGVIDGSKSLTKLGSGTLAINGANTYSGGSYLSGGYVSALNTGALGSGTVTIDGNTILNLNNTILSNTVVFGSGSGAIINSGSFVNVTGTYSITSGTATSITTNYSVQAGGDISFVNNLAATVEVQNGAAGTFTADVLGGGGVTLNAGGRGVFSGSVTGPISTSGSATFSGGVLGNVTVGGGTATFSGSTDGASAVNVNSGLAVFTGTIGGIAHATAAAATVEIRNRVLSTADVNAEAGGTVKLMGSQAFDATTIDNDGSVIVDRTANLALAAVISGSGSLTKSDATTLTLTGNNTFSGLTTISGGTLSVGNGGASGALAGNVVNNAALIFNRSDDTTYAGNISGSGGLEKLGAGKLTLSGSHSFVGATTVSAGTLAMNGQLGGSVAVASGAFLGGSGSIGGAVSGAGIVSPGNSPGILTSGQFDPSGGLGAAFEFTSFSPVYTSSTASLNDILRLTDGTPFTSNLGGSNAINVYFDVNSIASGQVFEGGFFTVLSANDLLTAVQNASFNYWIKDVNGATSFNGVNYSTLASVSGITGVTVTTVARTADFGGGNVSGSVTQFVIVPEPGAISLVVCGIAVAGWAATRRRRRAS